MTLLYQQAPNQTVTAADGTVFAYREFGQTDSTATPVVLFVHLAATLENWDPRLVDQIGAHHRVIAFDNKGVGGSSGRVPTSIKGMADQALNFIDAMGLTRIKLFSFSLGGFIAQEVVEQRPELVEKLVLTGTGGRGGAGISQVVGVTFADIARALIARTDPKRYLFFNHDAAGGAAAQEFLDSINARTLDKDQPMSTLGFLTQLAAIYRWGKQPKAQLASFITMPTLIANGDVDRMVPTENSYELHHRIPGSELVIYENSGHGGVFQYHREFGAKLVDFLADKN
ncbi:alpha/beta fold hydrolase [Rothia nasimurium]|uniref:alpha/beta fold hydrolase n=1 Tax=Rothia nasimurium TaxID=85336 RepID=UPI001F2E095B|nr:alpha/beta hydrolase [Rothia nasimurium]